VRETHSPTERARVCVPYSNQNKSRETAENKSRVGHTGATPGSRTRVGCPNTLGASHPSIARFLVLKDKWTDKKHLVYHLGPVMIKAHISSQIAFFSFLAYIHKLIGGPTLALGLFLSQTYLLLWGMGGMICWRQEV